MDDDRTLCLACSSSLPPVRSRAASPASASYPIHSGDSGIFITRCCSRPICPTCISSNPRLTRYDPCLACLGGVGVLDVRSRVTQGLAKNIDGAVRDQDTFVLGDDDDEEGEDGVSQLVEHPSTLSEVPRPGEPTAGDNGADAAPLSNMSPPTSPQYYLKSSDTLQGIALRFGVDVT